MMDGVLENIPSARISVVGVYRDEETLKARPLLPETSLSHIEERMATCC